MRKPSAARWVRSSGVGSDSLGGAGMESFALEAFRSVRWKPGCGGGADFVMGDRPPLASGGLAAVVGLGAGAATGAAGRIWAWISVRGSSFSSQTGLGVVGEMVM